VLRSRAAPPLDAAMTPSRRTTAIPGEPANEERWL
jgi:hypothetical protein